MNWCIGVNTYHSTGSIKRLDPYGFVREFNLGFIGDQPMRLIFASIELKENEV